MSFLPTRVLLVEDNPSDLELALLAFDRGGFGNPVDVVRDGAEALEYLYREGRYAGRGAHDEPRLILLDVKLPLIDGPEVLRRIKADPRTRHLPVVMLTTSTEDVDLRRCYEYGANSYIVKPVDMERFFRAVQDIGTYWLELNKTEAST
ncbi:response regulator [Virgisporangium aurantiacum]|uniref:Two-component system response regulator n=1 Tax=Virgisporangium aurantiacum TaxID=175570 RepID=A0A8J3ZBA8_9ACTN|nr:response regulator [Virgisporangium aurantiacum]GIJ60632.1 two-component system response regulator [Virgisporangium aurantiacum]